MLGFDWTRTNDFTRREMAESILGSRINSQGMEAASATPVVIFDSQIGEVVADREPEGLRVAIGGKDFGVKLFAACLH